jgi:Fe2+ or Zn2+ uptake regulation protein
MSQGNSFYCALKSRGLRLTEQRKAVISCFLGAGKPLSAEDIFFKVKEEGHEINLATVYRTLETLTEANLIARVGMDLHKAFYALCKGAEHLHHFFCLNCGESYDLPYCPFKEKPMGDLIPAEFTVTGHRYEVYGYCGKCNS